MATAFWARQTHKWLGLIVGIQALLWMASGVYMTVISIDIIHGDHLAHHGHGNPIQLNTITISSTDLVKKYPSMRSMELKTLLDRNVFEIHQDNNVYLIDATTGEVLNPISREKLLELSESTYQGSGTIKNIESVVKPARKVSASPIPMWVIHYNDRGNSSLSFSQNNGELLQKRHDLWYIFDFVWMLHIMDYKDRTDVNNNLLRVSALLGFIFALSGGWFLFYRLRRSKNP